MEWIWFLIAVLMGGVIFFAGFLTGFDRGRELGYAIREAVCRHPSHTNIYNSTGARDGDIS